MVPRLIRIALLAAALAAVAAAPARAAWGPAQTVSGPANEVELPTLGYGVDGRGLASWIPATYRDGHFVADTARTATVAPGATNWPIPHTAPSFVAGPVLYGQTRAAGLDMRYGSWNRCGHAVTLRARFGTSTGSFSATPSTVASYRGSGGEGDPALAANAAGQVGVVWSAANTACNRALVHVAWRRPGASRFGAALTLRGRGTGRRPSIAVGQGGDALVAWERSIGNGRTSIEARYMPAGGSWGPVQVLGQGTVSGPLTTAVMQNGRAYVAWGANDINETTGLTSSTFVAVRPAGARTFGSAVRLERVRTATAYLTLRPILAVAGAKALIAWTGYEGSTWRVRVAAAQSSGAFGAAQTVSDLAASASLGGLALLSGGTAAVALARLDSENLPSRVLAAVRPAGAAAFGAPEDVGAGTTRSLPLVALNPSTLQPTVAWTQNLGSGTGGAAKLDVRLRTATRAGP